MVNPHIRARAPTTTVTYDDRTLGPFPASPPVSVRYRQGRDRPCAGLRWPRTVNRGRRLLAMPSKLLPTPHSAVAAGLGACHSSLHAHVSIQDVGKDGGDQTALRSLDGLRRTRSDHRCQRALRNASFRTGHRPQHVGGHVCCAVGQGQSGRACAEPPSRPSGPAKRGRSAATRLDGGEHKRTLSASTAPAYHNILWSTASVKPAHSCARQHRLPGGALPRAPLGWAHLKGHSSPIVNRQAKEPRFGCTSGK